MRGAVSGSWRGFLSRIRRIRRYNISIVLSVWGYEPVGGIKIVFSVLDFVKFLIELILDTPTIRWLN